MAGDHPAPLIAAATPPALEEVHELLDAVWAAHPDVAPEDRIMVEIAVIEVAGNIATHASDGRPVTFSLQIDVHPDCVEALFKDNGRVVEIPHSAHGHDGIGVQDRIQVHDRIETPHSDGLVDELAESGRGLALTMDAVDEVEYSRENDLNHWRIMKKRS